MNSKYIETDNTVSIDSDISTTGSVQDLKSLVEDLMSTATSSAGGPLPDVDTSTGKIFGTTTTIKDFLTGELPTVISGSWPITSIGGFTPGNMWSWQPMGLADQVESCLAVTTDITFIKFKTDEKRSWFYRGMKIKFDILFDRSDENIKAKLAFYMDGKNE